MKYLMGLLALLTSALAIAGTVSWVDDGLPPARYQHNGTAAATIFTDQAGINHLCGKADKGFVTEACAFPDTDRKLVLPNPCSAAFAGQSFARLACHEMGHLNGWPGNHPRP